MKCTHVQIQKIPSGGGGVLKMFFSQRILQRASRSSWTHSCLGPIASRGGPYQSFKGKLYPPVIFHGGARTVPPVWIRASVRPAKTQTDWTSTPR